METLEISSILVITLTMSKPNDMTIFEYKFLKGEWDGPPGAALNQTYEFCLEAGWVGYDGHVTPSGLRAIEEYEK